MPDEAAAIRKFEELSAEGRRWKGTPTLERALDGRRIIAWPDLEIRQAGRGIRVRARPCWELCRDDGSLWQDDPMGPMWDWFDEEKRETEK